MNIILLNLGILISIIIFLIIYIIINNKTCVNNILNEKYNNNINKELFSEYEIKNISNIKTTHNSIIKNNNKLKNDKFIDINNNFLEIKKKIINKYIIIADWIITYLTKEVFIFAKNLEYFDWKIIKLSELNIEHIKKEKNIVLCITYDVFDISLLKCDNVFLIYKIDDLYPFKDIRNKNINNADIVIGPYQYLFNKSNIIKMYHNINNIKSFNIPYSAVNEFYLNIKFNNNPIKKCFVSGAGGRAYPLRNFIKTNKIFKNFIETLDHPSYKKNTHNIVNENYYKMLNKYICCFTDASDYKYILLKVFEICSVGSLLLVEDTNSDELNKLGFYDNVNCIMCNKYNLEDKIKWIFNIQNIENIDYMRNNGMELVRNKHTTKDRSNQFNTIIENIYYF